MIASKLIEQALRLINVPGRGRSLAAEDTDAAFDHLVDIIGGKAVSRQFIPGIRRHFFTLQTSKSIYSYGASSQCDLRSDDFDDDPAPIRVEDAYIREGDAVTNNEQVDEYRLENVGTWGVTGGGAIGNNKATLSGVSTLTQALSLTAGKTYTLRFSTLVSVGDVVVQVQQGGVDILNQIIDATDDYSFDFVFSTTTPTITFTTASSTDSLTIDYVSIIERGKDRLELPDGSNTSDYPLRQIDQLTYNRRFTKAAGGRPDEFLFSRGYDKVELRMDNAGITGEILVMDVLVNSAKINRPSSTIKLNDEAMRWLKYELANHLAGEYGKSLTRDQKLILRDAWSDMSAGTDRINNLRVDAGLLKPRHYDIDRGDL